jgi:hypothetical protein
MFYGLTRVGISSILGWKNHLHYIVLYFSIQKNSSHIKQRSRLLPTLDVLPNSELPQGLDLRGSSVRLRPIFMSAGTSVLGMVLLAIFPGQSSELYQGLGIALTGGLAFSSMLTPTVVPALMALLQDFHIYRQKREN